MDALIIIVMLILFVLAMIFVFSTALLTPYLGKKNLIFVVLLGLIVGVVGGAFLLSPIVDDIPDFTRTIVEESVEGSDVMELDLSTNGNLTQIVEDISSITGVQDVKYEGITIKIDEDFDTAYEKSRLVSKINDSNRNISNVEEVGDKTFFVRMDEGGDPQSVLTSIYKTFSTETYTHLKYTSMQANATVAANNVTKVMNAIQNSGAVVLNVTGPTEDQINAVEQYIPDKSNVVLISGVIGIIVAVAGFFIDTIYTFTSKSKKKSRKNISDRDRVKRKTVPGSNRKHARKRPNRDSIDIFDDSFDESSKQTIGSNKRFKPIDENDYKDEDNKTDDGIISKISGFFNRPSNSKKEGSNKKDSDSGKSPHIRPKRKD